jgi:hypothetical protein
MPQINQTNLKSITVVTSAGVFPILPYQGSHRKKLTVKCDDGLKDINEVFSADIINKVQSFVMSE